MSATRFFNSGVCFFFLRFKRDSHCLIPYMQLITSNIFNTYLKQFAGGYLQVTRSKLTQ